MAKAVIRYLRRAPTRLRKFWISWHHKNIYTARQIRQLARYETGITDVVDGDVSSRSGCYAAFVIFPVGRRIPENVLRAVRAMRSLGINVLACLNAPIDDDVLETLKPITHKVIFRNNIGFDFGA